LRQLSGIDLGRIEREYAVRLTETVGALASRGMVEKQGDILRLPAGKLSVSNEVIVELLRSMQPVEQNSIVSGDALEKVS